MSSVMNVERIEDTILWQRLNSGFSGVDRQVASQLAVNLQSLCAEAMDRMKRVPAQMDQYTLHDSVHLLRVAELMALIIPRDVLDNLNPIEIFVLLLSAHFHDQGMVLEAEEAANLSTKPEYVLFRNNWIADHQNYRDLDERRHDDHFSLEDRQKSETLVAELEAAITAEFIRRGHGKRSEQFVTTRYSSDSRFGVAGSNVASLVARICGSHTTNASELTDPIKFRVDESIGQYRVNLAFAAVLLRLADILDFDRDRTPDSLYRSIHFSSSVSLTEWNKHRSIEGWIISPSTIRFTAKCSHPIYQRGILQYMDWIDSELQSAHDIVQRFPHEVAATYHLTLPVLCDRSRIEPIEGQYKYLDLEFSLSRDEIVKLLMTDQLYGSATLCVRELLQNSLDALRYRRAIVKRDTGADWSIGQVNFGHTVNDDGFEVLTCTDNGVGMDESIVVQFLTRVGRSYYRSAEFMREREGFEDAGIDFDPAAQFGIGFMSVFMVGDHIQIRTRKDNGRGGYGEPLVVEINGVGGMIVLKSGASDQPIGTTVEILGRKKPRLFDEFQDSIRLVEVLQGYALATEFPIYGECTIPEIASTTFVPETRAAIETAIERSLPNGVISLEHEFSAVSPDLGGVVRTSLLADIHGVPAVSNSHATWKVIKGIQEEQTAKLFDSSGSEISKGRYERGQVSVDGVLVAGEPGREEKPFGLGHSGNPIHLGVDEFLLDVRGQSKPELSPARFPNRGNGFGLPPKWQRLQDLASEARGQLWTRILETCGQTGAETFWKLVLIYQVDLSWFQPRVLWDHLYVPTSRPGSGTKWVKLSDLGDIRTDRSAGVRVWLDCKNRVVKFPKSVEAWKNPKYSIEPLPILFNAISTLLVPILDSSVIKYQPILPKKTQRPAAVDKIRANMTAPVPTQWFGDGVQELLMIQSPLCAANRCHPLVDQALNLETRSSSDPVGGFARSVIHAFSGIDLRGALDSPDVTEYQLKWLGNQYLDVDWKRYAVELAPPYEVLSPDGQKLTIAAEHFERWAVATLVRRNE